MSLMPFSFKAAMICLIRRSWLACPMQRIVNTITKLPNGETKIKRDSVVTFQISMIMTISTSRQYKKQKIKENTYSSSAANSDR